MSDVQDEVAKDAPAAWEPEPREWTWMDIFKAPMIACKVRCMIISVATIAAIGLVGYLFKQIPAEAMNTAIIGPVLSALSCIIPCIIFGLGGTLVAILIKTELLDDDYPTIKEALAQYKGRILAATMVPLFLIGTLKGMHLGAYLYDLLCSIPYIGGVLYFASIPSFFIWLLITFFSIGVLLSMFVFPAIVAIRKHGWFDNVIDTLEAVGTKPHKVVGSIIVTIILVHVCCGIGILALHSTKTLALSKNLPGTEVAAVETRATEIMAKFIPEQVTGVMSIVTNFQQSLSSYAGIKPPENASIEKEDITPFHTYVTGLITGVFQTVLVFLIAGYGLNIIIAGGMLSYLHVREDDYWDDEDLADLEKLAKELEAEALKDQGETQAVAAEKKTDAATENVETAEEKADNAEEQAEDSEEQPKPKSRKSTTGAKKSSPRKSTGGAKKSTRKSTKADDAAEEKTDDDK